MKKKLQNWQRCVWIQKWRFLCKRGRKHAVSYEIFLCQSCVKLSIILLLCRLCVHWSVLICISVLHMILCNFLLAAGVMYVILWE
jgi:hypothetical protein